MVKCKTRYRKTHTKRNTQLKYRRNDYDGNNTGAKCSNKYIIFIVVSIYQNAYRNNYSVCIPVYGNEEIESEREVAIFGVPFGSHPTTVISHHLHHPTVCSFHYNIHLFCCRHAHNSINQVEIGFAYSHGLWRKCTPANIEIRNSLDLLCHVICCSGGRTMLCST